MRMKRVAAPRARRALLLVDEVEHDNATIEMGDRQDHAVAALAAIGGIDEGAMAAAHRSRTFWYVGRDARLQGVGVDQGGGAGTESGADLGRGLGRVVGIEARDLLFREQWVHALRGRVPASFGPGLP